MATDEFGGVAVAQAAPATDEFGGVPVQQDNAQPDLDVAKTVYPSLGPILSAMGHGAKDGWGDEPLGLPPDAVKWLSDKGIFGPEKGGYDNPFQAFNELLAHTVVGAAQIVGRTGSAALGAYQESMVALGEQLRDPQFGREMAAMPEAFFGSPHPMGIPKRFPESVAGPKPEGVYHILEPLGAGEGESVNVRLMRDKDGKIEALDTDKGIVKVGPAYQELSPEEAIAHTLGDHPDGTPPDLSKVMEGPSPDPAPSAIPEPGTLPPVMAEARDLGVIGPAKPDMAGASPAARAAAEVPPPRIMAAARSDDVVRGPAPGESEKAGNIRLDQIGINKDAHDVILEAAQKSDDFNQARAGNIPLAQIESLSQASGVPSEILTANDGLGRLMHNDAVVRSWLQAFHQGTDEIAAQMDKVAATGDEADIATLREMKLRFQHMTEQASGLTAESGRTLAVFKEFYAKKAKAEALGKLLEDNPGLDAESLKKLADAGKGLNDPAQLARFLHDSNKPTFWDKYLYYWVNALISGPITHTKYIGANAAFGLYEAGIVTPIAGMLGAARRAFARLTPSAESDGYRVALRLPDGTIHAGRKGEMHLDVAERLGLDIHQGISSSNFLDDGFVDSKGKFFSRQEMSGKLLPESGEDLDAQQRARRTDGVYVGEAAARTWGLLAGTPDALKAAWTAAKDNVMTPFPNEVAGKAVNPLTQTRPNPIGGKLGFAIGIPGRSAAGIHSFFRWLGYRAEIEAQAYRQAAKEGLSPAGQDFWQRRATLADQPTEAMMNAGIENGNHLTFIGEQGQFGQAVSRLANTRFGESGIQPFKLILPFTHIPGQILRAGLEQTPAAFLDGEMRADILGRNGAVKADTARARLIAGGAVSAMVANWAVNDSITGYGPTDQTERARWLRTHEPYSVRLGGWWYSYNKFGPIGDLVGLVANLVEVGPKVKEGEYAEAAGRVIKATSHILTDEVGMQGLVNLIDSMEDPDRKMGRFVAGQAASNLPYSSLLRQSASVSDPYMREAKTFIDQLRYQVPWARQDLLPKRDWLGEPMTNPGYASIIRQRAVNADPIDLAMSQLRGFRPAPPQARIGGVALPPKLYEEYQTTAGAMTRAGLETVVRAPGWGEIPPGIREQIVHSMVEKARQTAGAMMQARHPELIMQGIKDRQDKIQGVKPTKMQDIPVRSGPPVDIGAHSDWRDGR